MQQTNRYLLGSRLALITLGVYAAVSKLQDTTVFAAQLRSQPLAPWFSKPLVWALPAGELAAAGLLIFRRSKWVGRWLSFGLLLLFSGCVGQAVLGT
ncbi:MauE/DoxX family redox-associated membrane protein [Pontibacter mangrovi]|uniref:Methylamine utilisation protein MauE domain-containing protein n=1 Tax=Pontibacter mangrovi TaxID=2589816 RepID=A0A501WA16_9BACT|nr:MauE/DoxX family redox-associated membrane protein [Pontibacter mangrovi]TPE42416.1 hypothetical protein FJM65_18515 [Pontibacter mangrovi]